MFSTADLLCCYNVDINMNGYVFKRKANICFELFYWMQMLHGGELTAVF